jgi:hypothetical protein
MTAGTTTARRGSRLDEDALQLIAVVTMAIVAVLLGLGLRTMTEDSTSMVTSGDLSAAVPAGWVYRDGVGDTAFIVYDPRSPDTQYLVSRPADLPEGITASQVADRTVAARAAVLTAFEVLERDTAPIGGRESERVLSTWARVRPGLPVTGMEGMDLVQDGSGGPLVITLESPSADFEDALADFERFAASVEG